MLISLNSKKVNRLLSDYDLLINFIRNSVSIVKAIAKMHHTSIFSVEVSKIMVRNFW